jgi:hypothetical protein
VLSVKWIWGSQSWENIAEHRHVDLPSPGRELLGKGLDLPGDHNLTHSNFNEVPSQNQGWGSGGHGNAASAERVTPPPCLRWRPEEVGGHCGPLLEGLPYPRPRTPAQSTKDALQRGVWLFQLCGFMSPRFALHYLTPCLAALPCMSGLDDCCQACVPDMGTVRGQTG